MATVTVEERRRQKGIHRRQNARKAGGGGFQRLALITCVLLGIIAGVGGLIFLLGIRFLGFSFLDPLE